VLIVGIVGLQDRQRAAETFRRFVSVCCVCGGRDVATLYGPDLFLKLVRAC
jgi:hypothetical protein